MEDVSSLNDSNVSAFSDLSESSFRPTTPKKTFEANVLKSRSNNKRSGSVVVEDDLSSNGDPCSSAGNESSSAKKQKDRVSECSHKVIEKRRRDRINTSLGELSQLLPAQSNGKQGSGKLEKAEILELTVDYLRALQGRLTEQQEKDVKTEGETKKAMGAVKDKSDSEIKPVDHFGGYKDCTEEVFRFLVNVEAMDMQQPCFQRLMAHLRHQIQLLAESNSEVLNSKGKVTTESGKSGKHIALKRSSQGTLSSSSSTSSSMGEKSGSGKGGKAKRARLHAHHSSNNKVQSSSSNGNSTSVSSDNENSSDNARDTQSDSAICLDDDLAEISGSSPKEDENSNRTNGSNVRGTATARNGNDTGSSAPSIPSMLLQGGNIPLRAPFLAPPYAMPTYALHPAGTHYIPIVLHPSVPLPPSPAFNGQLPFGMMPPASGGGFGMPAQLPLGMSFPYVPPGIPPYGYQAPPMGFPFFNGLRKDLQGQGATDPGNGDSGSNGDDSSIELRISPESSANQTDTSPSSSEIEGSNTDEGGS